MRKLVVVPHGPEVRRTLLEDPLHLVRREGRVGRPDDRGEAGRRLLVVGEVARTVDATLEVNRLRACERVQERRCAQTPKPQRLRN